MTDGEWDCLGQAAVLVGHAEDQDGYFLSLTET